MDIRNGLRRWYELNARAFGWVHRVADIVAGLSFVAIILLATMVVDRGTAVDVPLVPPATRASAIALYVAVGVFALAVLVETLAGLRSFFSRIVARLLD